LEKGKRKRRRKNPAARRETVRSLIINTVSGVVSGLIVWAVSKLLG
jgi:hypothetical protein